jgi:VWFA-related protein
MLGTLRTRLTASLSLALAAAPPTAAQDPPTFRSDVELVRLDVTVVDRDGRPVNTLTSSDFEVLERGRPREIESFERVALRLARSPEPPRPPSISVPVVLQPDGGRCFLFFFDDVHVSTPVSEWVRRSLAPFLEREVKDGDWVTVVAPEEKIRWTARTPWEHRQLPDLIRRLSGQFVRDPFGDGSSHADWEAMQTVEYGSRTGADVASRQSLEATGPPVGVPGPLHAEMTYAIAMRRIRHTLGALQEAVTSVAPFRGRKSLFLVSEGFIRSPRLRGLYDQVIATARRANVVVHYVAPQGLTIDGKIGERWVETMAAGSAEIAAETGGRTFVSNDLAGPLRETLAESSAYYLLGIRPLDDRPGEHRVRVRVRRRDLTAVARSRYFLAAPGGTAGALPAATMALRSAFDATALPLRVSSAIETSLAGGTVGVAISISLDDDSPVGSGERRISLLLAAFRLEGGEPVTDSAEAAMPAANRPGSVVRHLRLEPGTWQLRVVGTDAASGETGSVLHTFQVVASPPNS